MPEILYIIVAVGAWVSKIILSVYSWVVFCNASLSVIVTVLMPSVPERVRDLIESHHVQTGEPMTGPVPFL